MKPFVQPQDLHRELWYFRGVLVVRSPPVVPVLEFAAFETCPEIKKLLTVR